MRTTGEVIEAGRGVLGGAGYPEYEIRVVDTVMTLWTRDRAAEETSRAFEVMWWPTSEPDVPLGERPITKSFEAPEQRERFLADKVRPQVDLLPATGSFERPHPLTEIIGEVLIAVTFVSVYVQLDFQPTGTTPTPPHRRPMNLEVPPHLLSAGSTLEYGEAGYANGVVALIGQTVAETDDYLDLGIYIGFDNGAALSTPLKDAGGYEVATFNTRTGVYVWTPT
ncbi:MAG TPA: hypothetical protein VE623_24485 [Acidimicrobiales bacterium]|jgi:hypothetical protein|nr:hypothetical protein [Acidimicrobiales bacterium]